MNYSSDDTIAALATASGVSAIGVIRLSGRNAVEIAQAVFPRKDIRESKGYTVHYGAVMDGEVIIDDVILSIFRAPKSYTGQDSVEISCHGSMYILQRVIELLIAKGARLATAGEFTMRAFSAGKMDLAQAEAVADLIASESAAQHRAAMHQMRGGFSRQLKKLRAELLRFTALIELELDFAEEDVEFADRFQLSTLLDQITLEVISLAESFRYGNVLKNGIKVVLAGRPNAGKSTLLNQLLNEDRAMVSPIPGTTRDTIEDTMTIEGIRFRFIDTAGLRETVDVLESMGIARSRQRLEEADIVLYLYDVSQTEKSELEREISALGLRKDQHLILLANKSDLLSEGKEGNQEQLSVSLSSLTGAGLDLLKSRLTDIARSYEGAAQQTIVTHLRHYEALQEALLSLGHIRAAFLALLPTDLIVTDIRLTLEALGRITGEITNDELLGEIFEKFCIGK